MFLDDLKEEFGEENIYNYCDAEYVAESIMDEIEADENYNVYIDDVSDAELVFEIANVET